MSAPMTDGPVAYEDLATLVGSALGTSSWREITQAKIDAFAAITDDNQWIHTDPTRAANGPFGGTVAHGFLTLCLATTIVTEVASFCGVGAVINYGCNTVRFTAPVPSGSRVRGHVVVAAVRRRGRQFTEVVLSIDFELEDGPVACTAELVILLSPEETS